jgi:hypothetical protein
MDDVRSPVAAEATIVSDDAGAAEDASLIGMCFRLNIRARRERPMPRPEIGCCLDG